MGNGNNLVSTCYVVILDLTEGKVVDRYIYLTKPEVRPCDTVMEFAYTMAARRFIEDNRVKGIEIMVAS